MTKQILVAFITQKLKDLYEELRNGRFEDKELYFSITKATNDLKLNPTYGIKVPRYLWPKEYIQKYAITNLWKLNLPKGWRLVYTIEADEIKVMNIILEWMTHKEYERRFKY